MNLANLQDKHANKLCFVAGASPSLRFVDYNVIKDYIIITVNSSILKFPNCNYFVTDDQDVVNWNYWYKTAIESTCIKLLYEDKLSQYVDNQRNDIIFYKHRHYNEHAKNKDEYDFESLKIYNNAATPIIGARSSIASAINLAIIMGCNPICLLGMDNHYEGNKRYFWQFDGEIKAYNINNRVFSSPNRGLVQNRPVDNHCVDYLVYWQRFANINAELIKDRIYNCSTTSLLNTFSKISVDAVIRRFGDRKNV